MQAFSERQASGRDIFGPILSCEARESNIDAERTRSSESNKADVQLLFTP